MSSRASKFYKNTLHLFEETCDGNLCLDTWSEEEPPEKFQDYKYCNSFTMPLDDWREFARAILSACDEIEKYKN